VKQRREDWEAALAGLDLDKLVFYDEAGVNTMMARLHGRSLQGTRVVGSVPAGYYRTSTLLSAMRLEGVVAPMLIDCPVNGEIFAEYMEEYLAPALKPGEFLVMDNLPAHKSERVTLAVEKAGCTLVYLPPYSPDFNPIENMGSKVKASMKAAAARTLDSLVDAVSNALHSITPEDCEGFFNHCGYDDSST
jgi:transposase